MEFEGIISDEQAAETATEGFDAGTFVTICENHPDEELSKISKFVRKVPQMEKDYAVPVFRFVSLGAKARRFVKGIEF